MESRLAEALEGRYELRGLLGHGGMGAVFLAAELSLDRLVAIKVLPPTLADDEELRSRFQHEAKTAARLDHPGIVPIYSVEERDGLHYFVMKFVPGTDLADEIGGEPMSPERTREVLLQSAEALAHAHRRGVVHRDVKPANIMIDMTGQVVLTDFGIAKGVRSGTQMTATGQMLGTPHYMSPEQMEGSEVDGRSDQYALGMVGYHMLTGSEPFGTGSIASIVVKGMSEYPESLAVVRPEVADDLVGAIERAIRKDPAERFPDLDAFVGAIRPGGRRAASERATREQPAGRGRSGARLATAAVLVVALGAAAYFGSGLLSGAGDDPVEAVDGGAQVGGVQQPPAAPPPALAGGGQGGQPASGESSTSSEVESEGASGVRDAATAGGAAVVSDGASAASAVAGGESTSTGASPPESSPAPEQASSGPAEAEVGYLSLSANVWAYVEIDGVELPDATPIVNHPLPPGEHVVVYRRQGYQTLVDTVEVRARNTTRRTAVLIPN